MFSRFFRLCLHTYVVVVVVVVFVLYGWFDALTLLSIGPLIGQRPRMNEKSTAVLRVVCTLSRARKPFFFGTSAVCPAAFLAWVCMLRRRGVSCPWCGAVVLHLAIDLVWALATCLMCWKRFLSAVRPPTR